MALLTIVGIADDELARAKASWTSTVSRLACLPVIVLGLAGLVACENTDPAPAYPDGAIRLRQNLPTPVGTRKVVAFNLDGTEAALSVAQTGGTAVTVQVTEGQRFTADGLTFDVLDVVPPSGRNPAPGAADGTVVIIIRP